MIDQLKRDIVNNLDEYKDANPDNLSLLKYCTPASGINLGGKVIFLLFEGNNLLPSLCLKTARKLVDNYIITEGYNNLKFLSSLIKGSEFENNFPQPLFLSTNGQGINFSVESACSGRRAELKDYDKIVDFYASFQAYLGEKNHNFIGLNDYFFELVKNINLTDIDRDRLIDYFENNFSSYHDQLPIIPQHGDLTLDNMLINDDKVMIFDCERFGLVDIVGFDLFHFLQKRNWDNFILDNRALFNNYFGRLNYKFELSPALIFLYYLNEVRIKFLMADQRPSFDFIVDNSKKFIK